ncbi:MAG TPA: hypothetical protein VMS43_10015 [Allosphingosinicella sp.]|nr:hypothetical protein [Allosphingosinicella sp.]
MKALAAALSLFALSSPALAQDGPSRTAPGGVDATPATTSQNGDNGVQSERRICRSVADDSTSRMAARRVCRTESEWRESSRRTRD